MQIKWKTIIIYNRNNSIYFYNLSIKLLIDNIKINKIDIHQKSEELNYQLLA